MSEPIELTEEEVDKAAAVFYIPGGMGFECRKNYIRESIRCINLVRAGDPVGTIRRTDTAVVALKVHTNTWKAFSPHGNPIGAWSDRQVSEWPVVYRPEVS